MNISQAAAIVMVLAFLITLGDSIFVHHNWLAAWFAFTGAYFACLCAIKG